MEGTNAGDDPGYVSGTVTGKKRGRKPKSNPETDTSGNAGKANVCKRSKPTQEGSSEAKTYEKAVRVSTQTSIANHSD